jgi:putative membrane protein
MDGVACRSAKESTMMYWGNGMGGWGVALMTVSSLLFWGLIIAGVVLLVRYAGRVAPAGGGVATETATPQRILAERFARGEIDEDEYARRLRVLDAGAKPHTDG